jgi:hypothetical protein
VILGEFIRKAEDFNKLTKNSDRDLFGKTIALHIIKRDYNKALKDVNMSELIDRFILYKDYDLPDSTVDISKITDKYITDKLYTGFLKKENDILKFLSPIYFEYFVAKYIADEFWITIPQIDDTFKYKVNLLLSIFEDIDVNFPVVIRCIKDFVKKNQEDLKRKVSYKEPFRTSFKNLFEIFINDTNISIRNDMIELFADDSNMQDIFRQN